MAWDASAVARGRNDGISSPHLGARTFSPSGSERRKAYADITSYSLSPSQGFENSLPHHGRSRSQFFGPQAPPTPFSPLTPTSPGLAMSPLDSHRPSTMMTLMMGSGKMEPAMGVKAHFRFEDPVRAQYNRSYTSSTNFEPNDKILSGLARRIDHCSRELITRKDFTALDDIREHTGTLKPLRYEATYQIYLRGSGVWMERSYKSFQKKPLNMESAKEVILSAHRMIGLFLLRHDKDFIWVDGPVKEQFSLVPELSQPIIGFPTPLTCIPRSRFIETTQSFESFPGYTIELLLSSRWRRRQPMPWEKMIRVNSRQSTPLNLPTAEQIFWKLARRVDEAIETRKMVFEEMHKYCDGLDGTYQCHHYEENAFEMMVSIANHLGPAFTHLRRNFRTDMILFPDPDNNDCETFLDTLKPVFAESRDNADLLIDNLNDLDLRVVELRGRGWAVERPLTLVLGSSGSYSRRSVEAILERVETAIYHILNGNDVICRITAHKRGHLILDKTLLAQRERGILRRDIPNPEVEKQAFVNRLENQIYDELAMVCMDTCSLEDFPEFDVKVAHPATDPVVETKEIPGPAPPKTTQSPAPDRTVKLAPAVSHAVRRDSDAVSSTGSDGTSAEEELPEDTVHNKYRWGKLVPDDKDSIHTDPETVSVTQKVPENETATPQKKSTAPRYNLFPSDSVPKSDHVRTSGDSDPKTPEPSLKTPPLSVPIQQPEKEQDSNMTSHATEDPSPETTPDDSILSNFSENHTCLSEVESQDKSPVADAPFPAPCGVSPQIEEHSLKRTDSKESVHTRPSTKHADSIPSTPSLDMSSPSGNSPRNSLLITPQYFTNTGATGRFFDVQGDSSDDGRRSVYLPESPTLTTKRHGAMLAMSGALVTEPNLHNSDGLPSPIESHSSARNNDLHSLSSSQKTIQAPTSEQEVPIIADGEPNDKTAVDVAEPTESEAHVIFVAEPAVEVSDPTQHEKTGSLASNLTQGDTLAVEREARHEQRLVPEKQDEPDIRQSSHTIDLLFDEVERLASPPMASTPELPVEAQPDDILLQEPTTDFVESSSFEEATIIVTAHDEPEETGSDNLDEHDIPATRDLVSQDTAIPHLPTFQDCDSTSDSEVSVFMPQQNTTTHEPQSEEQVLDSSIATEVLSADLDLADTPAHTSAPTHDETRHENDIIVPEYDLLQHAMAEQPISDVSLLTEFSSSNLIQRDSTTPNDYPLETSGLVYEHEEVTLEPVVKVDISIEGETFVEPAQAPLPGDTEHLDHDEQTGADEVYTSAPEHEHPVVPLEDSMLSASDSPKMVELSQQLEPSAQLDPITISPETFLNVEPESVGDPVSAAHHEEEPSCITVIPFDAERPRAAEFPEIDDKGDIESQTSKKEDEFEDDGAIIAQLEELSRNLTVGYQDKSFTRDVNLVSSPHQLVSWAEDREKPTNVEAFPREKMISLDKEVTPELIEDKKQQPSSPIQDTPHVLPVDAPRMHEAMDSEAARTTQGYEIQDSIPLEQTSPPENIPADQFSRDRHEGCLLEVTLSEILCVAMNVLIPGDDDEDIYSEVDSIDSTVDQMKKIPVIPELPAASETPLHEESVSSPLEACLSGLEEGLQSSTSSSPEEHVQPCAPSESEDLRPSTPSKPEDIRPCVSSPSEDVQSKLDEHQPPAHSENILVREGDIAEEGGGAEVYALLEDARAAPQDPFYMESSVSLASDHAIEPDAQTQEVEDVDATVVREEQDLIPQESVNEQPRTEQEAENIDQNQPVAPLEASHQGYPQESGQTPNHLKLVDASAAVQATESTEGHSYSPVSESFPDLVISRVRSRADHLSINTSHSNLPPVADDEELLTPKALDQGYFSIQSASPDPFLDSTAGPSQPLRHKVSSLYSTDRTRSSISTFLSVTTDNEPKTSYERLALEDLPMAPRSPFFPASAGYVGLHEEKRVELGIRDALMGPFRRVSGHVSSRPSTSGTMTPGGEKGKDKERRRVRWGRERRRGKSVDLASLAKFTGSFGGKKLTKRNPLVDDDVPNVPKIPAEHQQNSNGGPDANAGNEEERQDVHNRPRPSFASSRKSKDVPVTAHPVKTTEKQEDGKALPRLMMIFAGVTIAGKMLVGSST